MLSFLIKRSRSEGLAGVGSFIAHALARDFEEVSSSTAANDHGYRVRVSEAVGAEQRLRPEIKDLEQGRNVQRSREKVGGVAAELKKFYPEKKNG
ncbi:uncharacterized protein J3R85_001595 [Psidium guajava]|nr:uncharacterized protein J3R85_001595 [Psidium guajava]